jgi:hypothetical protein
MGHEERRHLPRHPAALPIRVRVNGIAHEVRLRDLCVDAAFVETGEGWPVGTLVELEMELPRSGGPCEIQGRVVRVAEPASGGPGVAVAFTRVPPTAQTRLDLFLQRIH